MWTEDEMDQLFIKLTTKSMENKTLVQLIMDAQSIFPTHRRRNIITVRMLPKYLLHKIEASGLKYKKWGSKTRSEESQELISLRNRVAELEKEKERLTTIITCNDVELKNLRSRPNEVEFIKNFLADVGKKIFKGEMPKIDIPITTEEKKERVKVVIVGGHENNIQMVEKEFSKQFDLKTLPTGTNPQRIRDSLLHLKHYEGKRFVLFWAKFAPHNFGELIAAAGLSFKKVMGGNKEMEFILTSIALEGKLP